MDVSPPPSPLLCPLSKINKENLFKSLEIHPVINDPGNDFYKHQTVSIGVYVTDSHCYTWVLISSRRFLF